MAEPLAGYETPLVLASPDAPAPAAVTSVLRDADEALRPSRRRGAAQPHEIVAVDVGQGTRGLAWARRVLDGLDARHVRLAVAATDPPDEIRALIDLLDGVAAVDVVAAEGAAIPVEYLLNLGVPVGTVGGWPATPALWAALALEGENRG